MRRVMGRVWVWCWLPLAMVLYVGVLLAFGLALGRWDRDDHVY